MLTLDHLKAMEPQTVFAHGVVMDNPLGVNMTGSGRDLAWVAVRGIIHDWSIYIHWLESGHEFARTNGDKVLTPAYIKRLVPCTDEAFDMYRI